VNLDGAVFIHQPSKQFMVVNSFLKKISKLSDFILSFNQQAIQDFSLLNVIKLYTTSEKKIQQKIVFENENKEAIEYINLHLFTVEVNTYGNYLDPWIYQWLQKHNKLQQQISLQFFLDNASLHTKPITVFQYCLFWFFGGRQYIENIRHVTDQLVSLRDIALHSSIFYKRFAIAIVFSLFILVNVKRIVQ